MKETANPNLKKITDIKADLMDMPCHDYKGVIIHTAEFKCSDTRQLAFDIDEWHIDRGWKCIGYHLVVERDGTVYATKRLFDHLKAAHTKYAVSAAILNDENRPLTDEQISAIELLESQHDYNLNERFIGICISGHGKKQEMTDLQRESLAELLKAIGEVFDVERNALFGHLHFTDEKLCPEEKIIAEFPMMLEAMNSGIGGNKALGGKK